MTTSPSSSTPRRDALVAAALEQLRDGGPAEMTVRKVAQRAGMTTMAVYSEFGGVGPLVDAVVEAGFADLDAAVAAVPTSDDPLADLWGVTGAFEAWAVANAELYRVIYGASAAGGYRRSGEELLRGEQVFARYMAILERAREAGLVDDRPAYDATLYLWTIGHGGIMVTISGYLESMPAPQHDFVREGFTIALVGLGADRAAVEAAIASVDPD